MKPFKVIAIMVLAHCFSIAAAQRVDNLEKQIDDINAEIALANKLLDQTSKDKETSLKQISLLDTQIKQREKLIATYKKQIQEYNKQINRDKNRTNSLRDELKQHREDYSKLIEIANRNRKNHSTLLFLLSSKDFNQAYRRLHYLQQLSEYRKEKINQILDTEQTLNKKIVETQQERNKMLKTLNAIRDEEKNLAAERKNMNQQIDQLKKKEKSIRKQIKEKEQETEKLRKMIEQIIAEEIERAKENEKTKVSELMNLTPEEKLLSEEFEKNKGQISWPLNQGVISAPFGTRPHPALSKVMITNNGIDIATEADAQAKAVYRGTVVSVNTITAVNIAVIIRHGAYFTVYSKLDEVYVKRGDKVEARQAIGRIHTDKDEKSAELHFELWVGKSFVNPENWLK